MSSVEDFVTISVEHYLEITKELEVYKQALEFACDELKNYTCMGDESKYKCDGNCATHWLEYYLQKAGGRRNDSKGIN